MTDATILRILASFGALAFALVLANWAGEKIGQTLAVVLQNIPL